jgi:carboxymethylproline synthase
MESAPEKCVVCHVRNNVLTAQFNASHPHNPFSAEMERTVTQLLRAAKEDPEVHAVVLCGGRERSFSVGGDFNEVKEFQGGPEVNRWIEDVVGMYVACLDVDKPTVAALDNFAIGIGFQLALCCDYRLGTLRSQLIMPELKNGIACVLGQYMLEKMVGRAQMTRIVVECERLDARECLRLGLLNSACEPEMMMDRAQEIASRLAAYPRVAYGATKRMMNRSFMDGLRQIVPESQAVHRAAFQDQSAQRFMGEIVQGR